jgi:hypothetical protein
MKNGENVTGCAICARLDALLAEAAGEAELRDFGADCFLSTAPDGNPIPPTEPI